MKRLFVMFPVILLCGCQAFGEAAADPAVQNQFQVATEKAAEGDMSGALIAAIGGAGTLVIVGLGKWLHKRMKDSPQGQVLA